MNARITENLGTVHVATVLVLIVVVIIRTMIRNKKSGRRDMIIYDF